MIQNGVFQARWAFPTDSPPIENVQLEISDGLIASIGKSRSRSAAAHDLGEVALIPGLVNAHTHLEFSDLTKPLGTPGMPFTDWLKLVIADRAKQTERPSAKSAAIAKGLAEAIASGTVLLGEIATWPAQYTDYDSLTESELHCAVFLERLGRNLQQQSSICEQAENWLSEFPLRKQLFPAISPHAPYSTSLELVRQLVNLPFRRATRQVISLAMHLAETREERELLEHGTGPFVDFLKSIGVWQDEQFESRYSILDYLQTLSKADRSLIIHGNYLNDREIEFIASQQSRLSVVYCPRTHDYFCHDPYPLIKLLDSGINVAIGTDSRASNPDLNLFEELKFVRRRFAELTDQQVLAMGTINGATGLGLHGRFQLAAGFPAQLNVVSGIGHEPRMFCQSAVCLPLSKFLH